MNGRWWRRHGAVLVWAAVVALLLLLPGSVWRDVRLPRIPWLPIMAHGLLLGVLGWLAARSFAATGWARPVLAAATATILYGTALEGVQHFVPGRAPEALDALVNALAASVGAWLALRLLRRPVEPSS